MLPFRPKSLLQLLPAHFVSCLTRCGWSPNERSAYLSIAHWTRLCTVWCRATTKIYIFIYFHCDTTAHQPRKLACPRWVGKTIEPKSTKLLEVSGWDELDEPKNTCMRQLGQLEWWVLSPIWETKSLLEPWTEAKILMYSTEELDNREHFFEWLLQRLWCSNQWASHYMECSALSNFQIATI